MTSPLHNSHTTTNSLPQSQESVNSKRSTVLFQSSISQSPPTASSQLPSLFAEENESSDQRVNSLAIPSISRRAFPRISSLLEEGQENAEGRSETFISSSFSDIRPLTARSSQNSATGNSSIAALFKPFFPDSDLFPASPSAVQAPQRTSNSLSSTVLFKPFFPDSDVFPASPSTRKAPPPTPNPKRLCGIFSPVKPRELSTIERSILAMEETREKLELAVENKTPFSISLDGKNATVTDVSFLNQGHFFKAFLCKVDGKEYVMKTLHNERKSEAITMKAKVRYLENIIQRYNQILSIPILKDHYTEMPNLEGKTPDTFKDGFILSKYVPLSWEATDQNILMVRDMRRASVAVMLPDDFRAENLKLTENGVLKCIDIFEDDASDELSCHLHKDRTLVKNPHQLQILADE